MDDRGTEVKSTAIYPNRIEDKKLVENLFSLKEFGNEEQIFYIRDEIVFIGYDRIVYGDHGPYIEFSNRHIRRKLVCKFTGKVIYSLSVPSKPVYYYMWLYPQDMPEVKIYYQLKTVNNLPDAPLREDGKPSKFNRKEGYADYKVGKFYISPFIIDKVGE